MAAGRELADRPFPANLREHESEGLSLEGRWVDSHDVRAGDVLVSRDGTRRTVLKVQQEFVEGFEVRNLTVQEFPSYAVGDAGLLAHNEGICDKVRGQLAKAPEHLPKPGTYAALVVDGQTYVARFHIDAWALAGRKGAEEFYGFAEIDEFGKVVRLFK